MKRHHTPAEVILICSLCLLTVVLIAGMYRAQLGFEWPDIGIVQAARSVLARLVG